ncbi:hypothetical protein AC094_42930 [Bacteroides fragilis]|uniref:Uncharacterized protein n=1 Tax=Bacteroides fragilis TaxID=817 RepID=A0A853PKB2_BACFG|nr:hypothetical protein M075_4420 [Bacteroides fragilis str. 20793-3]OCR27521.1 hypothetical protein AC094_42930 [Bacteroides fragilis]
MGTTGMDTIIKANLLYWDYPTSILLFCTDKDRIFNENRQVQ